MTEVPQVSRIGQVPAALARMTVVEGAGAGDSVSIRSGRWIRRTTTACVLVLAGIAAVVSFRHMHELALEHGEDQLAAALIPLAVDGTIVVASMSLLLASRQGARGGLLPWTMLIVGSLASLAANIAVAEPTFIARIIAGWPSLALIGAYEMLMNQIRCAAQQTDDRPRVQAVPALRRPSESTHDLALGG